MSKVIYNNGDLTIRSWDIVRLKNGMIGGIFGSVYQDMSKSEMVDENTKIILMTTPVSSITSYCYPCHVEEVIEHCGCFENQMEWFFKNKLNQPLYIHLEKEV